MRLCISRKCCACLDGKSRYISRRILLIYWYTRADAALVFCDQVLRLPQFQGCGPTVTFIRTINRLFELLNSRNPVARGYKAPMCIANSLVGDRLSESQHSIFVDCSWKTDSSLVQAYAKQLWSALLHPVQVQRLFWQTSGAAVGGRIMPGETMHYASGTSQVMCQMRLCISRKCCACLDGSDQDIIATFSQ